MDLNRLHEILDETTMQLRTGEPVVESTRGSIQVTDMYLMPHVDDVADVEKIDMVLVVVGVDKTKAAARKEELIGLLKTYPAPERLAGGPSYIEVGGVIGDQGAAFQLFALGEVLGLWRVVTPRLLGAEGDKARYMAGAGFVVITGFDGGKG